MPVPPLVRHSLGVSLRRVLPLLLTTERGDVEIAPRATHRLVATIVDEVSSEDAIVAITEEHVSAMPLVNAEVGVKGVGDGIPGHLPSHPRLQTRDVGLWSSRRERESGVASVEMG